jgi:glycosyltransferase involved in cell wall biosynthesis
MAARLARRLLARLDRAAVGAAGLVIVDTPENAELLPAAAQSRSVVVPVGAGEEWFQPPTQRADGPLRVVFFGLYTAQEGAPVIGAAIARCADAGIEFTMIARAEDRVVTASASLGSSVTWLDWVEADELPGFVATHDVALGIFGCKDKAKRVVPTKVYQGAAAGCVVVTARTDPQVRTLGDAAEYVTCGDADALADALIGLARDPSRVAELRRRSHELAARRFTPKAVVQPLVSALQQIPPAG